MAGGTLGRDVLQLLLLLDNSFLPADGRHRGAVGGEGGAGGGRSGCGAEQVVTASAIHGCEAAFAAFPCCSLFAVTGMDTAERTRAGRFFCCVKAAAAGAADLGAANQLQAVAAISAVTADAVLLARWRAAAAVHIAAGGGKA